MTSWDLITISIFFEPCRGSQPLQWITLGDVFLSRLNEPIRHFQKEFSAAPCAFDCLSYLDPEPFYMMDMFRHIPSMLHNCNKNPYEFEKNLGF